MDNLYGILPWLWWNFSVWICVHGWGEILSLDMSRCVALGMVADDGPNLYISNAYHKAFLEVKYIQYCLQTHVFIFILAA